jgi:hypothetical protein
MHYHWDDPKNLASPAVDTERHGPAPWSVQWSIYPGTGRMILAEDKAALDELSMYLHDHEIILHNEPQDLDMLERMGVRCGSSQDTMQCAFHLCSVPQDLKSLSYQLTGVEMKSWREVVWPASISAIVTWMKAAIELAHDNLDNTVITHLKRGKCADCGHQHSTGKCKHDGCTSTRVTHSKIEYEWSVSEAILSHIVTYTTKPQEDEDKPYNPWDKLGEMKVEGLRGKKAEGWEWEYLELELGPMPILGIGNCDLAEAVDYGCGDADMTGQVATVMAEMRQGKEWRIDPGDYDT